ncbi:MAG: hypothetical protein PHY31_10150 [Smithellaceae bacterium]|nr:hypothetical protein [Smithellaceae bacterium]
MNRREFLGFAGKGIFTVSAAGLMQGCGEVVRSDFPEAQQEDGRGSALSRDFLDMLYLASLAPSGHNAQPWTIRIKKAQHWILGSKPERWLPAVDPNNREVLLSLGAFLENLAVASQAKGYHLEYGIIAINPENTDICEINVVKAPPQEADIEAIKKRRTLRLRFMNREIKGDDLRYLTAGISGTSYFPPSSSGARYLSTGTFEANRQQTLRKAAQEELANWIRWSDRDAKRYRNGLTTAGLELEGFPAWVARYFYNRKTVLTDDFKRRTLALVRDEVNSGGGWITLSCPNGEISSLIEAGRIFERLFLRARSRGIAIHPMSQMLEEDPWRNEVAGNLGVGQSVQLILRVGYRNPYPDPVSLRMPVAWFTEVH